MSGHGGRLVVRALPLGCFRPTTRLHGGKPVNLPEGRIGLTVVSRGDLTDWGTYLSVHYHPVLPTTVKQTFLFYS